MKENLYFYIILHLWLNFLLMRGYNACKNNKRLNNRNTWYDGTG